MDWFGLDWFGFGVEALVFVEAAWKAIQPSHHQKLPNSQPPSRGKISGVGKLQKENQFFGDPLTDMPRPR